MQTDEKKQIEEEINKIAEEKQKEKEICKEITYIDFFIRIFSTIIIIYLILNYVPKKYFYLCLPIALFILDCSDNVLSRIYSFYQGSYIKNICCSNFIYQILDKINDIISYFLVYKYFHLDNYFLFFLIWRTIGVVLFGLTRNSVSLIIMFDFMKEYLLYKFFFGNNYTYLPLVIIGKMTGELYWHTFKNHPYY